jgi:hypothetical protein
MLWVATNGPMRMVAQSVTDRRPLADEVCPTVPQICAGGCLARPTATTRTPWGGSL